MEHSPLGRSGPLVSRIALGCMSLPVSDARLSIRIVHSAVDAGINLIDTADLYDKGLNEETVGHALEGRRDRVVLATKVGNRWRPDGDAWDWDPSPDHVRKAVEESLRRLRTDRIDLYQLHGGTVQDPIDELIGVFEDLRAEGKILHYGISSIRPRVIRTWVERSGLTSVMTQYGVADRRPDEEVLPLLAENGIGVIARGVLAKGMLCGKEAGAFAGHDRDDMLKASEAVRTCSKGERSPVQTAIRFALHSGAVTSVAVGVSTPTQLEEAASVFSTPLLSDEEIDLLSGSVPSLRYLEHR